MAIVWSLSAPPSLIPHNYQGWRAQQLGILQVQIPAMPAGILDAVYKNWAKQHIRGFD